MKPGEGQSGSVNWGHPGRKFKAKDDPLGDMGVGNARPLLIALAIGALVSGGLFLAWEERAADQTVADEAASDSSAFGTTVSKPSPAEMRSEVEKLLRGNTPDTRFRVLKPEERPSGEKPFTAL